MKKGLLIGISRLISIVALSGYGMHWVFFDVQRLPAGIGIAERNQQ
ncbi:hypothetical protein [Planomicrobium sp. CPCC 101079]|nr:hypothetical protein [Planomicrobium sp. CPCC 101079]